MRQISRKVRLVTQRLANLREEGVISSNIENPQRTTLVNARVALANIYNKCSPDNTPKDVQILMENIPALFAALPEEVRAIQIHQNLTTYRSGILPDVSLDAQQGAIVNLQQIHEIAAAQIYEEDLGWVLPEPPGHFKQV